MLQCRGHTRRMWCVRHLRGNDVEGVSRGSIPGVECPDNLSRGRTHRGALREESSVDPINLATTRAMSPKQSQGTEVTEGTRSLDHLPIRRSDVDSKFSCANLFVFREQ